MTKTSTCCDAGRLPEGDDDLIDFHTHILKADGSVTIDLGTAAGTPASAKLTVTTE